ncbi:YqzL family protein [Oceanobacillus senegalensis]|nr:YqzL family protein [Oceanobacillus senegalensis]
MIDLTWKLFSQTGDIETYLLYKELESEQGHTNYSMKENEEESPLETNL